jgi:hypothetical protein
VLAWSRGGSGPAEGAPAAILIGSNLGRRWSVRVFDAAGPGEINYDPDVYTQGRSTYLAYARNGTRIVAADNRSGAFRSRVFGRPPVNADLADPEVAASGGRVFVAWWALFEGGPDGAFLAEQVGTGPTTQTRLAVGSTGIGPQLTASGGKATVVLLVPNRVYARTQR